MREILRVSSKDNERGIVVLSNENVKFKTDSTSQWNGDPIPGRFVHMGFTPTDGHHVYRLDSQHHENEWAMFLRGQVTFHEGAILVAQETIGSSTTGSLIAIGANALLEVETFDSKNKGIHLILDGVVTRCENTESVRLTLGLLQPQGDLRHPPTIPKTNPIFRQVLVNAGFRTADEMA